MAKEELQDNEDRLHTLDKKTGWNMHIKMTPKTITFVTVSVALIVAICYLAQKDTKAFEKSTVAQKQQYLLIIATSQAKGIGEVVNHIQDELERVVAHPELHELIISNTLVPDEPGENDYSLEKYSFECFSGYVNGLYRLDARGIIQNRIPFKEDRIPIQSGIH